MAFAGAFVAALALAVSQGVRAQSLDTTLPDVDTGVLGEPQRIEADVGADTVVSSVALYYRFGGETGYRQVPMRASGASGIYTANVPTADVRAERLEFHIVAQETGGGILLKGSAAEPLVRVLERPPGLLGEADAAPASGGDHGTSGARKYLYFALGALAVGALAAAASDGGSSSDDGCAPEGCRLTLTLPVPGR